jgi:hypothetical protein
MLDSDNKYASTLRDSMTESTLQLTKSSISFHESCETDFKPSGEADAGSVLSEAENHTSSNFSGPSKALLESRSRAVMSRLIVKWGVPLSEDGEPV